MLLFYSIFFCTLLNKRILIDTVKKDPIEYSTNTITIGSINKYGNTYIGFYTNYKIGSLSPNTLDGNTVIDRVGCAKGSKCHFYPTPYNVYVVRLDTLYGFIMNSGNSLTSRNNPIFNENDVGKTIPLYISGTKPSFEWVQL